MKSTAVLILILLCFSTLSSLRSNLYPLDSEYHRPEELLPTLISLQKINPDLTSLRIAGHSSNELLPIYGMKISLPDESSEKPSILVIGQHHAEEVIGLELALHFIGELLRGYESNEENIIKLIHRFDFWIIPTINPEGFNIVNSGLARLHRKNKSDTNFNRQFDKYIDGVDLNRNYPFNWEYDESADPTSKYFKGFWQASEKEISTIIDFYEEQKFQLALFYHSSATGNYSEMIFFPWKWGEETSPDYYEMKSIASVYANNTPKLYHFGNYTVHTGNTSKRGFARDFIYSEHNTFSFLIEVGGNSPYGEGIINPDNTTLNRIKHQHFYSFIKTLHFFSENLVQVRLFDSAKKPLNNTEVHVLQKKNSLVKPRITTRCGSLYLFNSGKYEVFELFLSDYNYLVKTDLRDAYSEIICKKARKTELTFNRGNPYILLNPVFYTLPELEIKGNKVDILNISLFSNQKLKNDFSYFGKGFSYSIEHAYISQGHNNFLVRTSDLPKPINPNLYRFQIIYLENSHDTLTYCEDIDYYDYYILHPHSKIKTSYPLAEGSSQDYLLKDIVIFGESEDDYSEILVYLIDFETGHKVYSEEISFNFINKKNVIGDLNIPFRKGLELVLSNRGYQYIKIYKEQKSLSSVRSLQSEEFLTDWYPLDIDDLAVRLELLKKTPVEK